MRNAICRVCEPTNLNNFFATRHAVRKKADADVDVDAKNINEPSVSE